MVVVSAAPTREFWQGRDPIGRPVALGSGGFEDRAEVVGVVDDVRYDTVEQAPQPTVYLPLLQSPRESLFLFLRTSLASAALVAAVRREVQALDRDLPLVEIKTMQRRFAEATIRTRLNFAVLGAFAAVALALAAMGIYGIMAYSVEQRTREIGIRLALGAGRSDVLRLVLGGAVTTTAAGIGIGFVAALGLARFLAGLLYEVEPFDPATLATVAGVLAAVALTASYVPACRAARLDPLASLRLG